ncbi:MAG: DedD protein [Halothiobacillaceae bacterium]|nr:MAG: DedD protein [Halothiobacillaceae bacterium]
MDEKLKQRVVGGVVLFSLAVIVVPLLFDSESDQKKATVSSVIPPREQAVVQPLPLTQQWADKQVADLQPKPLPADNEPPERLLDELPPSASAAPSKAVSAPLNAAIVAKPIEKSVAKQPPEPASPNKNSPPVKTVAEVKPAMVTTARSNQAWLLQVGSFSQRKNAEALRDKLTRSGYRAFVTQGKSGGKTISRVRIGPELLRPNADKLRKKLEGELNMQVVVVENP